VSVFAGLFLFAAAFYGVVLWMFVVRRGIAWAVALIAASATFGAWLVAFVLTFEHEEAWLRLGNPSDVDGGKLRAEFVPLGDWHLHPRGGGHPSQADREARFGRLGSTIPAGLA
jgi:hypothetical protein